MRTRRSSARIRDKAVFRYQFGDSSDGEDIDHAGASASRRSKKAQEQDADSSNDEMVMTQDLGDEGDDHHSAYENEEASVGEEVEEEEDDEEEDDDDDEEDEDDDEEEDEDDKEEDEDDKKDDSVAACNVEDATSTRSTPVKAKKKLPRRRSSTKKATVKASTTTPRHKKLASEKASSRSSDRKSNIKTSEDGGYLEIPMATTIYDGVTSKQQPRQTYIGCNDRAVRLHHLVSVWYGPDEELVAKIQEVLDCWFDWPVLPPKARESEVLLHSSSSSTSREKALITDWRESINAAMTSRLPCLRSLSPAEAAPYRLLLAPSHKYNLTDALNHAYTMPVLVGPDEARQEFVLTPGTGHALAQSGIPLDYDESQDKQPSGWMLDTGGIVTSISWAPRTIAAEATQEQEENRDKSETQQQREPQLLAVSVLPHADQDVCQLLTEETTQKEFKAHGIVQLWELYAEPSSSTSPNGATEAACPGSLPPRLCRTLCFPHGRARRVEWNPAGSFLAVLCANGAVYVLDADTPGNEEYDCIEATAMSWSNVNRLVLGYSDGSIALWSVFPCHLLSRHAVHHSHVVELATGYPSMPQLVASTPLGGTMRLTDLSEGPSHEFTQAQAINVTTQPGLLAWTDHMLGFFALYPSSRVNNTAVGFMHHANFPLVRTTLAADSLPSAAAAGRTHPFLLVGLLDGSAWCLNPLVEHFNSRSDSTYRIRLLQHEHRPRRLFAGASSAGLRGASRVLQGFVPEKNRSARKEPVAAAKKGKAVKKRVTKRTGEEDGGYTDGDGDDDDDDDDDDEDDDDGHDDAYDEVLRGDASRFAVHEPLTRITAMEWNPNKGYGCWAAMAMASGLVRIMDLGIDEDE